MELCCACAWLLSDERELVNLLARGANIIAFGIREAVFALNGTTITMTRNVR